MKKKCFQPKSMSLNLDVGTYYFCTCGHSKDQPFCDSTHTSDFKPKRFYISEASNYSLCLCKDSLNMPFCDGSHRRLAS
ncbi:MAG: CDGSH iron-sulfur domain-containing protein [bacterium]